MIEQEITMRQTRESQRQTAMGVEQERRRGQASQLAEAESEPTRPGEDRARFVLAHKGEIITRKLGMIRLRLAPKKVDSSAGIANLRAATPHEIRIGRICYRFIGACICVMCLVNNYNNIPLHVLVFLK